MKILAQNLCLLNARGWWIVKWVSLEPFISWHVPKCFAGTLPSLRVQLCRSSRQPRRDRGSVCTKGLGPITLCLLFIVRLLWPFQPRQAWGIPHPLGVYGEEMLRILRITVEFKTAIGCEHPPNAFYQDGIVIALEFFPENISRYSPERKAG